MLNGDVIRCLCGTMDCQKPGCRFIEGSGNNHTDYGRYGVLAHCVLPNIIRGLRLPYRQCVVDTLMEEICGDSGNKLGCYQNCLVRDHKYFDTLYQIIIAVLIEYGEMKVHGNAMIKQRLNRNPNVQIS